MADFDILDKSIFVYLERLKVALKVMFDIPHIFLAEEPCYFLPPADDHAATPTNEGICIRLRAL